MKFIESRLFGKLYQESVLNNALLADIKIRINMKIKSNDTHQGIETISRSILKTVSYRITIVILDFVCIYLFTGKMKVALGFTIVSNLYTTVFYFLHERIWDKIKWGKKVYI